MRIVVAALLLSMVSFVPGVYAHDEGHGPKLTEEPQQGGIIASVVEKKGSKKKIFYKAELVQYEEGNIGVYIYDVHMDPVDLSKFDNKAHGEVEAIVKKKAVTKSFELTVEDDAFEGTAPKAPSKPFDIAITIKESKRELLAVFENLD